MGAAIVAGIEAGWVDPVINREYAMEEVQQVHYDIIHSKGAKGKLVLRVDKEEDLERLWEDEIFDNHGCFENKWILFSIFKIRP